MTRQGHISSRDLERLSAYLDGTLSAREVHRLEVRLRDDLVLRQELADLRETIRLVSSLPMVRSPRNFTLTPEMVGLKERPRAYPVLQFATALATFIFFAVVGVDVLTSSSFLRAAAPAVIEQVAMEDALPEANALKAMEVPGEDFVVEEAESRYAEPEIVGIEEPPAFTGEAEHTFDRAAPTSAPDDLKHMTPTTVVSEFAEAPASTPTGPTRVLPLASDETQVGGVAEGAGEVPLAPSPLPATLPIASATPSPTHAELQAAPGRYTLRLAEFGFGILAVLLAVLTLWVRRKGG